MQSVFVEHAEALEFMDFDPFGLPFRTDPAAHHARLIEASPGFVMMEGVPSAFVASYDQTLAVLRDFKTFSSQKPHGLPGMQRIDFFNSLPVMNYSDPPDHTRRRKVASPAFNPRRAALLEGAAEKLMDELIDRALTKGEFDAVGELTMPLSMQVLLTHFLGVEPKDHHLFMNFVGTFKLLDTLKSGDPKPKAYQEAWEKGRDYCREQQEIARRGESDSLIGLIAGSAEGGAISDDEMMAMMVVLLTGGVTTVAGAAAGCLMNLARHPEVAERIRHDPDLASPCLEESLRLNPLVSIVMRFAAADTRLGDATILKGMPVYAMIAVACQDPAVFPDPYSFDIDRPNVKAHVAFGHGLHTCIGNTITRNIVPKLIHKVAVRMLGLRPAAKADYLEWEIGSPRSRHPKRLDLVT